MTLFPDVTFALTNKRAAPRLLRLIEWLELETVRLAAAAEKVPDDRTVRDNFGRLLATDNSRRRDALQHEISKAREDITSARVWLLECEVEQSWQIGVEIALWLNRPALCDSVRRESDNGT